MFKRFTPICMGLAMLAIASVQGYAFMVASDEVPAAQNIDLIEMIETLQGEMDNEELSCEEMLAKLDAALEQIDTTLDAGIEDESNYLVARDALIEMRLALPCLGEQLAQAGGGDGGGGVVGDLGAVVQDVIAPSGGGGGGSVGGGGGGFGRLALIGAGVGIPLALSGGDDDAPGVEATMMNGS